MRYHATGLLFLTLLLSCVGGIAGADPLQEAHGFRWNTLPVDDPGQPEFRLWYDWVRENKRLHLSGTSDTNVIAPAGDYYVRPQIQGEGLELTVERGFARPGDRWIEVFAEIEPSWLDKADTRLEVRLFALGQSAPVAEQTFVPQGRVGLLQVDLRRHNLEQARLSVSLLGQGKCMALAEVPLSAEPAPAAWRGERIAAEIDVPEGYRLTDLYPVTFGVPFPAGALWDVADLRLVDGEGRTLPGQGEITGRWGPDGSVRWVRFDALVRTDTELFVAVDQSPRQEPRFQPLTVTEDGERVVIDTGAARYVLAKGPSPISRILVNDEVVATAEGTRGLYVIDQLGRLGVSSAEDESMVVESRGPVAATVRFEGFYRTSDGLPLARHITRLEAFAGQAAVKVTHTLILTNDSDRVWFKDIGWELAVAPGVNPRALFGVSRDEPEHHVVQEISSATPKAYALQESHFMFGHGTDSFKVVKIDARGDEEILSAGEEMGDWAALAGEKGGLLVSVREAARQHPKEFEISDDRVVIRLFSGRAGEELDFDFFTLAEKWNLGELTVEQVGRLYSHSAVGWSKTHELLISPLPAGADGEQAAGISLLNSRPVYVHVDPRWIYETKAMGNLHPKDSAGYPEAEALLEEIVGHWNGMALDPGFYGFVDYYSGPTFTGGMGRRYRLTYTLRGDLWGVYARSGERWIREFAAGTNRAFMDNHIAHWDGPNKTKGLYMSATSSASGELGRKGDFPFYWEERTSTHSSSSTNLNQFMYDYYLTGNRRAGDILLQFSEALKRTWSPDHVERSDRVIMLFRALSQSYGFTWDLKLRAQAEATAAYFYDPEGITSMTKDKPHESTTYKINTDVRALIEGWRLFGTPPYYDLARRNAGLAMNWSLGLAPDGYTYVMPVVGEFLFEETKDPLIPGILIQDLRWATALGRDGRWFRVPALLSFVTEGIALSQAVIEAADKEDISHRGFWLAFDDDNGARPVSIVMSKGTYDGVEMNIIPRIAEFIDETKVTGPGGAEIRALERPTREGADMIRVSSAFSMRTYDHAGFGHTQVSFPKEVPGEEYEIQPTAPGEKFVTVRLHEPQKLHAPSARYAQAYRYTGELPLVIHAPQGWVLPRMPVRVYFRVPDTVNEPKIFFSENVFLFDPQGNQVDDGQGLSGWYDLPTGQSGLWSFEADSFLKPPRVEVRNVPPFFAMDDPQLYFEPRIPWIEWVSALEDDATLRGQVPIEFKIHTPPGVEVTQVDLTVGDELLYRGRGSSHTYVLDSMRLADRRHTLTCSIWAGTAFVEKPKSIRVENWWQLADYMQAPLDASWFGTVSRSRTSSESGGWTYTKGEPTELSGIDRRIRRGDSEEYLTWETPNLRMAQVVIQAVETAVEPALKLLISRDGEHWEELGYTVQEMGIAEGRYEMILAAEVPEGVQADWCQLRVLPGHFAADALHITEASFTGLNQ
ncbi:MAG: hypothetical protein ACOYEP_07540 [Limnochordia bacterium]